MQWVEYQLSKFKSLFEESKLQLLHSHYVHTLDVVYVHVGGWRGRLSATVIVDEPIPEDEDEETEEEEEKKERECGVEGAVVDGEL